MTRSYGIPGKSVECRPDDGVYPGDGFTQMSSDRPAPHWLATLPEGEELGVWVEPGDTREYKHFAPRDLLDMFAPERVAIMVAKAADVQVAIWYDDLIAARYVTYSDEKTQAGMSYMLQAGLLTQDRHDEIVETLTAEREG